MLHQGSPAKRRGWLRCLMPWSAAAIREDVEPDYPADPLPYLLPAPPGGNPGAPRGGRPAQQPPAAVAGTADDDGEEPGTPGSVLVREDVPDYSDGSFGSALAEPSVPPFEVHANDPYGRGQLAVLVEGPLDKEAVFLRACEQAGPGFSVFVGDGLNDLLALLSADCGVLIGAHAPPSLSCLAAGSAAAQRYARSVCDSCGFSRRTPTGPACLPQARARRCSAPWRPST